MAITLQFFGATEQVTGSLYLLRTGRHTVMLECGLIQGGRADEASNRDPFPVATNEIDAVVISHAHITLALVQTGTIEPLPVVLVGEALPCDQPGPDSN
jgi:predicted metal-dependent RNase